MLPPGSWGEELFRDETVWRWFQVLSEVLNALVVGTEQGSLYALVGIGLIVVYSATKVFNFAHGNLIMASTVGTDVLWQSFHLPILLAMLVTATGVLIVGAATERIAVRPVLSYSDSASWVLSTYGVAVVIGACFTIALTSGNETTTQRYFPTYLPVTHVWRVGKVILDPNKLFIVLVCAIVAVSLWLFLGHTITGRALRAVADDREAAAARGISVGRISTLSFVLGALVAAITGAVAGPVIQADLSIGTALVLNGFIAAAIGGLDSIEGAVLGGVVLGLIGSFIAEFSNGQLVDPISLGALLLVLLVRPNGLLARKVRVV
jgi:branched-chain amino acid transport system permease protein